MFRFSVEDVFLIASRGTVVVGRIEGEMLNATPVVVRDGDRVVATATAYVDMCVPRDGRSSITLVGAEGDTIERGHVVEPRG